MIKTRITFLLFFILLSFGALTAHAQEEEGGVKMPEDLRPGYAVNITSEGGSRASVANIVLQLVAGSLIYAAGPIAVLMIAIGGFRYITSRGDQNQMEEAKKTITWAIIGLIVIIVSWAIVTNVITILTSPFSTGSDSALSQP